MRDLRDKAEAALRLGKPEYALPLARDCVRAAPASASGWWLTARALHALGWTRQAIDALSEACTIGPSNQA